MSREVATRPGPTLEEIRRVAAELAAHVDRTPMERSRFLGGIVGHEVHLKAENLQRTGSYKIRGATARLARLTPEERARGVVAASAGNHAQGVALAARELGIPATIFMPVGVALPKLQATRGYGADVVLTGDVVDETLRAAAEFSQRTGAVLIPPFDHHDVVAGQASVALEILEQVPEVRNVVVPMGGGGLVAGIATAFAQLEPELGRRVRVIAVQAEHAASFAAALESGEPVSVTTAPTIADGIHVGRTGALPFEILRDTVAGHVEVPDDETAEALVLLMERAKLVVEPAGAVGVAAAIAGRLDGMLDPEGPTVFVLSGGNVDPMVLERVVSRGLLAAGRYLVVTIPLPDRPGQLKAIAGIIADANANVVEVLHTRHGLGLQISEVEIEIHMETRGEEHADAVLQALREAGYRPRVGRAEAAQPA
ncbi:MAG: threonine ammonia-lyase [Actinomycetales bacterium]|nr:threonine ammonia-lyase [Actinomycetales bacterium]